MTERTRQTILGLFLAGVLVFTAASAGLFAAHRRQLVTALGQPIALPKLGFSIRMPEGWKQVPVNMKLLGPSLAFIREPEPHAGHDSLTDQSPYRYIYFLITPPQASSDDILKPLLNLVGVLDINDNYFKGYRIQWSGPTRPGIYPRRSGTIGVSFYLGRRLAHPIELGLYEEITAGQQVFWCVLTGNTQMNAADKALLEAVAGSFRFLPDESV